MRPREPSLQAARAIVERLRKQQSYISRCESGEHRLDVAEPQVFAELYGKALAFFTARP